MFTGGAYVLYGMKAVAVAALRSFIWAARKIRSEYDPSSGKVHVNLSSDWQGRADRNILEQGMDYIENEFGKRPIMERQQDKKIFKKTRSQNRRRAKNK